MDAEVLFDYDKTQDDELTLRVGTIIHNVKEIDEGWCEGELNGFRGMFPDNFVQLISVPIPAAVAAHEPVSNVRLRNTDAMKKIRRARVTFSYAADNSDELSLQPGQVIEIIEEEEEGWWRGRLGVREGVFPSNFVEEIHEERAASSPEPPASQVPAIDSQTGERPSPSGEQETKSGVRVGKGMPAFDPSKARAQLKQTSKTNMAPPLEKPPDNKKSAAHSFPIKPPAAPAKLQAKVSYDYDANNEDELTIKLGELVEVVDTEPDGQDGWWEVSLRGKVGLVPDNFVELLEAAETLPLQPKLPSTSKEPPSKQMVPPPAPKKADSKKAPIIPAKAEPAAMDPTDFPVPKTTPLDTSAIKDRPKHKNRPPSNRSTHQVNHEEDVLEESTLSEDSGKALPPWKAELMAKKKQPKLAPKPGNKPKPAVAVGKPDLSPVARARFDSEGSASSKTELNLPPATTQSKATTAAKPAGTSPATAVNKVVPPVTKPAAAKPAATPVEAPTKTSPPLTKPATPGGKPKPVETKTITPGGKPKPVETKPPPSTSTSSSSTSNTDPPPSSTPAPIAPSPADTAWKDAVDKLREDFAKFKVQVTEKIDILTDDLDKERKHRASLEIDIDRLKKEKRSLVN